MTPSAEPDPRRWRILGVSLVVGFMSLLDVTIVNVAIPSIRSGLGTTSAQVQWVVSGYALAFGLTLVTGGRLGDAYGRRRLMVIGLLGFIASSAAVGLAPSIGWVVVARLAQGAAAGFLTPQNAGLVQDLFSGAERGRAFGLFGLTVSVSSALGPVIGGLILAVAGQEDGWRWIFLVNVPIGLVALVYVARVVPGRRDDVPDEVRIDLVGALLLGLGVLLLLFPLVSVEGGARSPLLLLLAAPVCLYLFVRWEARTVRRGGAPLLDVHLLREVPGYASGLAVGAIYFTGFTGVFLVLSIHLQDALELTPLEAGAMLTPFAIGSAVSAPVAGRLVSHLHRRLTVVALVLMMSGVLGVVVLAAGREGVWLWWTLPPCLLLAGLGGGAVVSPNFTLTLSDVPPRMGGAAGGAIQTGQRIGSSLGAALLVTVYQVGVSHTSTGWALRAALLVALAVLAVALAVAVADLRLRVRGSRRARTPRRRGAGQPPRRPGGTPPGSARRRHR